MNQVNCPICSKKCVKSGKTKAGSQRWLCKNCKSSITHRIDNEAKELQIFLDWLFGKKVQLTMPGEGRSFRRKTAKFWDIWTMPPKIEEPREVLFLDGIYLGRKACILICCDEKNVVGWYLCCYEHAGSWIALMKPKNGGVRWRHRICQSSQKGLAKSKASKVCISCVLSSKTIYNFQT